jgi:eukaryotic-like serine/threonine-protein kinase
MTSTPPVQPIRELFDALMDEPAALRLDWLERQRLDASTCIRLMAMLDAQTQTNGPLDRPATEHVADLIDDAPSAIGEDATGQIIGAYTLRELIGRGGMATVYAADRSDGSFKHRVAVKILRRTLRTQLELRLFARERQALAALEHPGVARLIDGGITPTGTPYLVMELVRGQDLLSFARNKALSIRERMQLFAKVCDAVNAAHQALIVHRDIKPANIFVTDDGQPKLLDFGIAKILSEDDAHLPTTFAPMTPEYAAPEQFDGRAITTVTDVYGLGVVLHELLTGARPKRGDTGRASDSISELTTLDLYTQRKNRAELKRLLRGDIDNILRQSLAAEPSERYASAGDLAADLRRFLDGQPVAAHPPSGWYATKKFVRRNTWAVATAVLLSFALMATAGVAVRQAHQAREESARANTTRDFMLGLFESAQSRVPGDQRATPEQLVDEAQRKLALDATLDNTTRAEILSSLAIVSFSSAQYASAEKALNTASSLLPPDDKRQLRIKIFLAASMDQTGQSQKARDLLEPLRAQILKTDTETAMEGLEVLMNIYGSLGEVEKSIDAVRDEDRIAQAAYKPDDVLALKVKFTLGNALSFFQKFDESQQVLLSALQIWKAKKYPTDALYLDASGSLASNYANRGRSDLAEVAFAKLLAEKREIYQPPHDTLASAMRSLGAMMARNGKSAESIAMLRESLMMFETIYGEKDEHLVQVNYQLGLVLFGFLETELAEKYFQAGAHICRAEKMTVVSCARIHLGLGQVAARRKQWVLATQEMAEAEQRYRALYGDTHINMALIYSARASLAVDQDLAAEGLTLARQSLAIFASNHFEKSRDAVIARFALARALWRADQIANALIEIDQVLEDWAAIEPIDIQRRTGFLLLKAQILRDLQRAPEAKAVAISAVNLNAPGDQLMAQTKDDLRKLSGMDPAWR